MPPSDIDLALPLQADLLQNAQDDSVSPVDVAFTIARIIDSDANIALAKNRLDELAQAVSTASVDGILSCLKEAGYKGATYGYMELENSCLDKVIERKKGIPISLGMVIIGIGERLNIDSFGLNFPSHYLVSVDGVKIDPFTLQTRSDDELKNWAREHKMPLAVVLARSTNRDIAVRMLNNVAESVRRLRDHTLALQIYDYLELLAPERFDLPLERAHIWMTLGDKSMAREELFKARNLVPDQTLRDRISARLEGLDQELPTSFN